MGSRIRNGLFSAMNGFRLCAGSSIDGLRDSREALVPLLRCLCSTSSPFSPAPDSSSSIEFSKARSAFNKSLSERRKAWFQEMHEKREVSARRQAEAQREREKRQHVQLQRLDANRQRDREASMAKIEEQRQERKAMKAVRREESLRRETGRQAVLASLRDEKKRQMLEDSKHWIGDDRELEAAIDRAVDGVEMLFVSSKVINHGQR